MYHEENFKIITELKNEIKYKVFHFKSEQVYFRITGSDRESKMYLVKFV